MIPEHKIHQDYKADDRVANESTNMALVELELSDMITRKTIRTQIKEWGQREFQDWWRKIPRQGKNVD